VYMIWQTRDGKVLIEPALKQYDPFCHFTDVLLWPVQDYSFVLVDLCIRSETRKVGQRRGNLNPSTSKEAGDSVLLPLARAGQPDWL